MTEDEMVGWHYQLNGRESDQTPGDSEGQGTLVYCSPCGRKESDMTEQLNYNIFCFLYKFICIFVHIVHISDNHNTVCFL